jgi:ATP-dependent Lon protease
LKLLFPHVRQVQDIDRQEFQTYCLEPARQMRATIKRQLHLMDVEYNDRVPDIAVRT